MGNQQAKEERIIEEIATKETYLECPVLVDLDHGTVRHRHEERLKDENGNVDENGTRKVGYFYHPKLNDFSEDAQYDNNRLKYVFAGPTKDSGKRLYYIYGTNMSDKDKGIHHEVYKPQGKGYNWPQSYRKANNLYYEIIFLDKEKENEDEDEDTIWISNGSFSGDDSMSQSSGIVVDKKNTTNEQKDNIRLKLRASETVSSVIERVSLQLLIPSTNIHLMWNRNEVGKNELIVDLQEDEKKSKPYFLVMLKLS